MSKVIKHVKMKKVYKGQACDVAEEMINDLKAELDENPGINFLLAQEDIGGENLLLTVTFPEESISNDEEFYCNDDVQEFIYNVQSGINDFNYDYNLIVFIGTILYKDDDQFAYNLSLAITKDEVFGWNKLYIEKDDELYKSIKHKETSKWCGFLEEDNMKTYKYFYDKEDMTKNKISTKEVIDCKLLYQYGLSKMIKSEYCNESPIFELDLNGMAVRFWLGIGEDVTNGMLKCFYEDKNYEELKENGIIVCLGNGFSKDIQGVPQECYMLLNDKRNSKRNGTYTTGDGENSGILIEDDIIVLEV